MKVTWWKASKWIHAGNAAKQAGGGNPGLGGNQVAGRAPPTGGSLHFQGAENSPESGSHISSNIPPFPFTNHPGRTEGISEKTGAGGNTSTATTAPDLPTCQPSLPTCCGEETPCRECRQTAPPAPAPPFSLYWIIPTSTQRC